MIKRVRTSIKLMPMMGAAHYINVHAGVYSMRCPDGTVQYQKVVDVELRRGDPEAGSTRSITSMHLAEGEATRLVNFIDWGFLEMDKRVVKERERVAAGRPEEVDEVVLPAQPASPHAGDLDLTRDNMGRARCERCNHLYTDVMWRSVFNSFMCDVCTDESCYDGEEDPR